MATTADHADLLHVLANLLFGTAGIAVMTCSLYGWGQLSRRLLALPDGTWPVSAAIGLASILFLGGVLNLCGLAYPPAFVGIALIGVALAAGGKWRLSIRLRWRECWHTPRHLALWGLGTGAFASFTIATQVEPSYYNHADDFQKNLAYVVRMLETGTLSGSPLNGLGIEALGGQSFLHGFIASYLPLRFVNGADAVFCFFLCLALAGSVAFGRSPIGWSAFVGVLAVFLIDPQYLNVSSLYSMAAMVSALIILRTDPREGGGEEGESKPWRQAALSALFYAGSIALKPTSCIFVVLHFGIGTVASTWLTHNLRATIARAARTAVLLLFFLAPWLLLYRAYYSMAILQWIDVLTGGVPISGPEFDLPGAASEMREWRDFLLLLSPRSTFYGAPILAYTCLAIGLMICSLSMALPRYGNLAGFRSRVELVSASTAAALTYLFWVVAGPQMIELTDALRYSIPVLIGSCSAILPLWAAGAARGRFPVCSIVAVLLVALFAPSTRQRVGTLLHQRSQLAYLHHWERWRLDRNLDFEQRALQGGLRTEVQRFQGEVPPGEEFVAWISTPFLLNFTRNKILDISVDGLGQPWGRIPPVRYIVWQHSGYGAPREEAMIFEMAKFGRRVAKLNARALDVLHWLQKLHSISNVISDRDEIVVMKVDQTKLPPP